MAYEEYRGRCIGRLMTFLYKMTHHSDRWTFGDAKIFDGPDGNLIGSYYWRDETDIPVFRFSAAPRYSSDPKIWLRHFNEDQQARAIADVLLREQEDLNLLNSTYDKKEVKPYFQIKPILWENAHRIGWKMEEISDSPKKHRGYGDDMLLLGQMEYQISSRIKFFSRYPSKMEILHPNGSVLTKVSECMKFKPLEFSFED